MNAGLYVILGAAIALAASLLSVALQAYIARRDDRRRAEIATIERLQEIAGELAITLPAAGEDWPVLGMMEVGCLLQRVRDPEARQAVSDLMTVAQEARNVMSEHAGRSATEMPENWGQGIVQAWTLAQHALGKRYRQLT